MYELIKVTENCYYIQCPAKIGLAKTGEDRVCLIDSGNDKDAGKKVKKLLDANGWVLEAIYNTHSHADHIGGNKYLQNQTRCRVYAPGIERDFTEHTILEPSFLYGGNPPEELRHKFLLAEGCEALPLRAAPTDNIAPLAELNKAKVHEIAEKILHICAVPTSFEVLLKQLFEHYSMKMSFEQHALVGSTVRSYLTWLKSRGELEAVIEDSTLLWHAI